MKYKFLKLRIIVPSLIVIMLLIIVLMFFVGGLEAASLKYNNIEWLEDNFLTPTSEYTKDGKTIWKINGELINNRKYITDNEKYVMYVNEDTTIVSIFEKLDGWTKDNASKEKLLYTSAIENGSSSEEKSNVSMYYYDDNGNLSMISSFDNSVNYLNRLAGQREKHYKIRYNSDGTFDVLYQIGEFSNVLETFPKYFTYSRFEELFIGNVMFGYDKYAQTESSKITVTKSDGSVDNGLQFKLSSKFSGDVNEASKGAYGYGFCFSNEAALYILQNKLATIEYNYNVVSSDNKELVFTDVPEDENEVLEATGGYWNLYNILDEEGNLKFVAGVNCNREGSPVKYNPFLTPGILNTITGNTFYPISYKYTNEKGEEVTASTDYRNRANLENAYLEYKAFEVNTSGELYKDLVVGPLSYIETSQKLPTYLISNADEPTKLKMYSPNAYTISGKNVYYDYNNDGVITEDELFVLGGYQARDLQGNYLFIDDDNQIFYIDKDGNRMLNDDEGNPQPVSGEGAYKPYQSALTKEITSEENEIYGASSEAESKAFQLAIRFELTTDGLEVTLINGSLIEGLGADTKEDVAAYFKHDNVFGKVEICKFLTTNNLSSEQGQIVLPDGSGAIISFNSVKDKQYAAKYSEKPIYGQDNALNRESQGYHQQNLMFPMYGFVEQTSKKGVVAIVEKGAPQSSITANFKRKSAISGIDTYNYAYFTTNLRSSESVQITSTSSYRKVSEKLYTSDIKYVYKIIEPAADERFDYTTVANTYRNYLIKRYDITEMKDTTTTATPTFTFIGAYEKKEILLGVVYDAEKSLTTFEQAGEIVDDLRDNGIDSMNINYTLWTNDVGFDKYSYKYKVNKTLGGKNKLIEFNNKIKEYGYNSFLDYTVSVGYGYDMSFGALKYNAKSISGSTTSALQYVLSTGLADATGKVGGRLSPAYYNSLVTKYMKNYVDLQTTGINIYGLGTENSADYSRKQQIYSGDGLEYQVQALASIKESGMKVMLNAPYDYAFKYVDVANSVPVETTLLQIVDYSIPFYQLVCSGLFDYTSKTINYDNDNSVEWNILKAIETGSNLNFEISASDTSALLDTMFTSYYNSYYANWKDKIIYMNKKLNEAGIYKSRLVNHEIITDTLSRVTYENGLTILVNYSNSNYVDSSKGIAVRANWFAIEQLGREE